MKPVRLVLPMAVAGMLFACGTTKKTVSQQEKSVTASVAKTDTGKVSVPIAYEKVITSKAITQRGLFTVHNVDSKWYFEIPDSLLNRDILIVNRISKAATELRNNRSLVGYGGDKIGEQVIQFSKVPGNRMFIKRISFVERSYDSTENGMYRAIENSNYNPIVAGFDVKAISPDSTSVVVDVTDYLNGDNETLFFSDRFREQLPIGPVQKDKSFIKSIQSYPLNVEIKTVKTYGAESKANSFELNSSMILLPKLPMRQRYYDQAGRIGYFTERYRDYDKTTIGVEGVNMITRWRMEPKPEDEAKYKRGELVEPQKPIVFYIDPATPKKWVRYLIQGVNDWQKAFEKAGFKNAIYAKEVGKTDTSWSQEDARHSVIVYKASKVANASGPVVIDPRTGEILESHINWYHNVMALLHDWYMIQAGPLDARARKLEFDESLMGQLIRFVASHEVGHTLGLRHNFGASSLIPVDSLRSKSYVEANGFCPSIMDYARFNYVAQPEDNISESGIMPRIGVYDEWAINWGYRWLPQFKTPQEESIYCDEWLTNEIKKDKRLLFLQPSGADDPRCLTEDLGDNPMKAGFYGIENLKRVLEHLPEWTYNPEQDNFYLQRLHKGVLNQYERYINNVLKLIGARYYTNKTGKEKGDYVKAVPEELQKEAFQFIKEQLFKTPVWLDNENLYSQSGIGKIIKFIYQEKALTSLLSNERLAFMMWFESAYSAGNLLDDCKNAIWEELKTCRPIDQNRRNLQRLHILALKNIVFVSAPSNSLEFAYNIWNKKGDVRMLVQFQLKELLNEIEKVLPRYKDRASVSHLRYVRESLKEMLDPKFLGGNYGAAADKAINLNFSMEVLPTHNNGKDFTIEGCNMWKDK